MSTATLETARRYAAAGLSVIPKPEKEDIMEDPQLRKSRLFQSRELLEGISLNCANCGGEMTHHQTVEVFERSEDAPNGIHVKIDGMSVQVDRNLLGNPSSRRDGLTVLLFCEECPYQSLLTIEQHKGQTILRLHGLKDGLGTFPQPHSI